MPEVIHGDAFAVLSGLPSASVDAVITDPPYSSGGQFRGDRLQKVKAKYVQTDSASGHALPEFGGDSRDQRGYLRWCTLWLAECLRVTKPGGVCALFTDWRQLPVTTDALQAGGWVWRGIVPWHKPNGRNTQGRFANTCEYVVWGTNGPRSPNAIPGALPGFFQVNTPRDREHITQKPVEILRELVRIAPRGGLILDPFAGSGTTGVAAVLEGRDVIAVEHSEHWCDVARERITAAQRGYRESGDQLVLTPTT